MDFNGFPGLKDVFGQTAYRETRSLEFLHHLVKAVKPKMVLELGTGKGCSTAFMALAMGNNGKVVSVDNYERPDINNQQLVVDNLTECGVLDKVELVACSTFDCADKVRGAPEIVFMDASHRAEGLRKEYESLRRLLPDAHIIVIDDALFNDIIEFVMGLVKEHEYQFYFFVAFHQGMAILAKTAEYGDHVWSAIKQVEGGL